MENKNMLFTAQNIYASYGEKEVLRGLTFSLPVHSLTGLIGANGSGKTTLLRCITNRMHHKGDCCLKNERLEGLSERQIAGRISYIPQKSGIRISILVIDVVLMGYNPVLKLFGRPSKKQVEKAKEALREVGMESYMNTDYLTLSEGQKQLVILARTMIEESSLLLLDEPDSALDVQNRYHIMKRIKTIVASGEKAGLISLHDPVLALEFCDQLLLLKEGKCVQILQPAVDPVEKMEKAFRQIYGNVSLAAYKDRKEKQRLAFVWED